MTDITRDRFPTRSLLLRNEIQRHIAIALLSGVPLDPEHPLECVVREASKEDYSWISVKEHLPDPEKDELDEERNCVLVYWDPASLADYLPNPQVCSILYLLRWAQDAIAWRPLPPNPQGEKNDS